MENSNLQTIHHEQTSPSSMSWIPIAAIGGYLGAGVLIMATPSARTVIQKECFGVANYSDPRPGRMINSRWKVVTFFIIVYGLALLAWPLFLRSWFPQKIEVSEPGRGVPKSWLVRKLDNEEIVSFGLKFRAPMQAGDEVWEFNSPSRSWEHLAGRAGIALVRDGDVVDSIVTMLN